MLVYCYDPNCPASKYAYPLLTTNDFENVRRYVGGILDWEEAGLPVEGAWFESGTPAPEATK
jgi:rhodanese-related sulfurtransferase